MQDHLQSQAEAYAENGVERLAGKGWRELERQQQLRADADIAGVSPCSQHTSRRCMTLLSRSCCNRSVCLACAARVAAISAVPFYVPFMAQATRRQRGLHTLPSQSQPQEIPPPLSPPPTPYCSIGEGTS